MIAFAKKTVSVGSAAKLLDLFSLLQRTMGWPHDLMLMSKKSADDETETIYIAVPDSSLLSDFEGFEPIERADLPDHMTPLVIRRDGLAKQFPDIAAKIRGSG